MNKTIMIIAVLADLATIAMFMLLPTTRRVFHRFVRFVISGSPTLGTTSLSHFRRRPWLGGYLFLRAWFTVHTERPTVLAISLWVRCGNMEAISLMRSARTSDFAERTRIDFALRLSAHSLNPSGDILFHVQVAILLAM